MKGSGTPGAGAICAVRIDDQLSVQLCEGGADVQLGNLQQRASLPSGTDEQLLNAELSIVVHDSVFERVLNHVTA